MSPCAQRDQSEQATEERNIIADNLTKHLWNSHNSSVENMKMLQKENLKQNMRTVLWPDGAGDGAKERDRQSARVKC